MKINRNKILFVEHIARLESSVLKQECKDFEVKTIDCYEMKPALIIKFNEKFKGRGVNKSREIVFNTEKERDEYIASNQEEIDFINKRYHKNMWENESRLEEIRERLKKEKQRVKQRKMTGMRSERMKYE